MLNIEVLNEHQMRLVDQRQARQQAEWKRGARSGKIVRFMGEELVLLPGVFPPKSDTSLLAGSLNLKAGAKVLDVGTGCGALAIWAARQGAASVVAVDTSITAVKNASLNVQRLALEEQIQVREGDVFSTIRPSDRFDVIIANLPGRNKPATDEMASAQWDTNFRAHQELFVGAKRYLSNDGAILMVKANYPDLLEMASLAKGNGFSITIVSRTAPLNDDPRVYYTMSLSLAHEDDV